MEENEKTMRMKKNLTGWLLILLFVLVLTGCDGSKDPEERGSGRKATATPTQAESETPTPTEVPEVTPTEVPEVTPTEAPEITPTEVPEITPTDVPEATPTPVEPPKVAVSEGPLHIIGKVYYESGQGYGYSNQGSMIAEQMYLVEDGYLDLMHQVTESNFRALKELIGFNEKSVDAKDAGLNVDDWSFMCSYERVRSDSVLFSYRQKFTYCEGATTKEISVGKTFRTATGEAVTLRSLVTDYDQLQKIVAESIRKTWDGKLTDPGWQEYVTGLFESGDISWMATETGILIWFLEGELVDSQYHEPMFEVKVTEYPALFEAAYVGDYNSSLSMKVFDYEKNRTKTFNKIVTELVRGIGSMSEQQVKGILEQAGLTYDDEGIEAGFIVRDPDEPDRIYDIYFSETDTGRILNTVGFDWCYVRNGGRDGKTVCEYVAYIPESSERCDRNLYGFFDNAEILSQMEFGFIRHYTQDGEHLR